MDIEKFERDVRAKYKRTRSQDMTKRVSSLLEHISDEWRIPPDSLSLHELKIMASAVIDHESAALHDEVEELLVQKERIERQLERKSDELHQKKYSAFDAIEKALSDSGASLGSQLHQIKLQTIDLFDILGEMVETAIITTLEKGHDIEETIEEILKEFTYETLSEGPLSSIRMRQIITTILQSAIDVSEATPNSAEAILRSTLRGIRNGLIKAIERFKQQLLYMPDEAKTLLVEDYPTLHGELQQADALFSQVVISLANQSTPDTKRTLDNVSSEIHFDMEELVHISKETVEVMREQLNTLAKEAVARGSKMLNSETAKEAKRMGVQAWSAAKAAIDTAIKSARERIDKK
jgi:hypothetical protein